MGSQNARLMKEFRILQKELPQGIICTPKHERLDSYEASIEGPPNTPYERGRFLIDVSLSSRYPIEPPSLKFKSRIYHPNIDDHGNICLDILKTGKKGSWNPSWTLGKVLVSMTVLLSTPNPHDPLMPEIADQLLNDRAGFERTAREWTSKYAMGFNDDPAEYMVTSQELAPQTPERPVRAEVSGGSTSQDDNDDCYYDVLNDSVAPKAVAAKRVASADSTSSASSTAPAKKKLGLSRKSASATPAADPAKNALPPPLPGKPPTAAAGIRRLGLSRNRNAQKQQNPMQLYPLNQPTDESSQAESIEVTSDDSSKVMPKSPLQSPKARKNKADSDSSHSKRQKKGASSLSQLLASNNTSKKSRSRTAAQGKTKKLQSSQEDDLESTPPPRQETPHVAESARPERASQFGMYTMSESAASEESEEVLFMHEPVCSSSTGEINSSMDYECLLSPAKNPGHSSAAGIYEDSQGLATIDESPLPLPPSSPVVGNDGRNDINDDIVVVGAADHESYSHDDDGKDNGTTATASAAKCAVSKENEPGSARRKDKGKAPDLSRPARRRDSDDGIDGEQKVLYESHFGPLDLGLPPIRVSAQRKLMRRRARPEST
ncbi:hypothetical protein EV175_000980 [Coemansia sp. RSA 1933]|nr:hypothetical protein EV175_000980 [Coemansia sp. RSA 1933]